MIREHHIHIITIGRLAYVRYIAVLVCAGLLASGIGLVSSEASANVFGSYETQSRDLSSFRKWTNVLQRYQESSGHYAAHDCKNNSSTGCRVQNWQQFLTDLSRRATSRMQVVREVNDYLNKAPYVSDQDNWGTKDYWETPAEFFSRGGDCEDYAIVKYLSLMMLGFNTDDMRIVVLNDTKDRDLHAVLSVRMGGTNFILDNKVKVVKPDSAFAYYKPIYSINDRNWWRHSS